MAYFNTTGSIVADYVYDVFGRRIVSSVPKPTILSMDSASTQRYNPETGDIGYLYRDCTPDLARWRSRDPIGEFDKKKHPNLLYGFVKNNPIEHIRFEFNVTTRRIISNYGYVVIDVPDKESARRLYTVRLLQKNGAPQEWNDAVNLWLKRK